MEPYVISIRRQFAAMGRQVATLVAKDLGIEFYDRALVEEVSKRMNLDIALISGEEETVHKKFLPLGFGSSLQDEIFATQKSIIQDLGTNNSCILVGRLADSILSQHPRHLSVYVFANDKQRMINSVDLLGMTPEEAKKTMHNVDSSRDRYRKKYAPHQKEVFDEKHLMLDTGYFGIEGTATLIAQVARQRFHL